MNASATAGHDHDDPPLRTIPDAPWGRIGVAMLIVLVVGLGAWEAYWRFARDFVPAYRDGFGLWTLTQRRIEREPTGSIAIIGSSRVLFDMHLDVWERETGRLPIQLALPGTNPRPILRGLAADSDFAGLLLVGVTPPLFFTPPAGVFDGAWEHAKEETPAQALGQRLSMLVEPYLAFYYLDAATFMIIRRQTWWPERRGMYPPVPEVRRLEVSRRNRQSDMWVGIEDNDELRTLAHEIWRMYLRPPLEMPPPDVAAAMLTQMIDETVEDVQTIRARGGEVVFARMPSTSEFREVERGAFPRDVFWDRLIAETGAVGIHFEDYPELQNVRVPEWSHIHSDDTEGFTERFLAILRAELAARGIRREELEP